MSLSRSLLCALGMTAVVHALTACAPTSTTPMTTQQLSSSARSGALLYSYPKLALKGKLLGIKYPSGLCTDPRTNDVWVVWGPASEISEFAHGATTAMRTLKPSATEMQSCAVNPSTGDLFYYDFVAYDSSGNAYVDGDGNRGFRLDTLPSGAYRTAK